MAHVIKGRTWFCTFITLMDKTTFIEYDSKGAVIQAPLRL